MTKVIISGSRSIKVLPKEVIKSLDKIIELGFEILIGDAQGVDTLIQQYLKSKNYQKVTVYYALFSGNAKVRNNLGFNVIGINGNYTTRDYQMCKIADYGLAIWDGKSKGTFANINRVSKTKVIKV